ncbi:glycosyltransferase family 39 protein [Ktedonobacteria bacterium brp13]|nr:glycosyltransferase family 39 protein [Ktedonobacteria bacterium brp13]
MRFKPEQEINTIQYRSQIHFLDTELQQAAPPKVGTTAFTPIRGNVPEKPLTQQQSVKDSSKAYRIASYLVLLIFAICQLTVIFLQKTGPFYDEGIYVTAGLRSWQGKGVADGYLVWFAGSLLWPMMAGLGYLIHGLVAVRIIAFLLAFVTVCMLYLTTNNLFGPKVACFTVIAFTINGPFMALAHLGVYDSPALAFTSISFWCITQLKKDHRIWLCLSAISLAIAMIAKYPIGLMILPILGMLISIRKKKSIIDISLFLFIFVAAFFAFFLPVQFQVGDWLFWSIRNKPTFGATESTIIAAQLYLGLIPFIIAILGFLVAPRKKQAIVLLLAGLIWPAYHILSKNPVSDNKHVVFGFLFTYPLIGLFLSCLWQKKWFGKPLISLICVILVLVGAVQLYILDYAWPDVRQPAMYLVQNARPGDLYLINDAWPYTMYLYAQNKLSDPWQVYDNSRIANHENKTSICKYTWYVDEKGSYPWSDSFLNQIKACHAFIPVYHATSTAFGLGSNLEYVQYQVTTTIYENINSSN